MTISDKNFQAAVILTNILVKNAPKDTWNLALNGIRIMQSFGRYYVLIGGEIAPYAYYTNEEKYNKRCKGWIEKSIEEAMPYITQIMSGEMEQEDVEKFVNKQETIVDEQLENAIKQLEEELAKI